VLFRSKERRSAEAGIKYFFLGTLSSAIMLLGMALVFGLSGETGYAAIGPRLGGANARVVLTAMILFFVGLFFKAAFVPFHMWAPDVYEGAPTPLVIFLSTAPKVVVFAVLIRAMTMLFGGQAGHLGPIFQFIALATMFWGNLAALAQKSLKRMMAYSSIAQAGYLAIGLAAWGDAGRQAVLYYAVAYVFMNAGAFGLILLVDRGGRFGEGVDDLRGLARRAPMAASVKSRSSPWWSGTASRPTPRADSRSRWTPLTRSRRRSRPGRGCGCSRASAIPATPKPGHIRTLQKLVRIAG
jgi:NADH-quinone oxidoreductase subunit N